MKEVDVSNCTLICAGDSWTHEQFPSAPNMSTLLERKENYCTWFQPKDGGVDDQFPAFRIQSKYYAISLRVQKVLFRHVRLKRNFNNREKTANGVEKLKIPKSLLMDKQRTSCRFKVQLQFNFLLLMSIY